jgi:nicotinate-nucleotide adenylyltransferase
MARAALAHAGRVVFVLPRAFPHKSYDGAGFAERLAMLQAAVAGEPRFEAVATEGGLFVEIAAELRRLHQGRLLFLCGRDAAERIVGWDYGRPDAIEEMIRDFELLVAARAGEYEPPVRLAHRVMRLEFTGDEVSASEVRRRIRSGEPWEHLVPDAVVPLVRKFYLPA